MSMRTYGMRCLGVVARKEELNLEAIKSFFGYTEEDWDEEEWDYETLEKDKVTILPKNSLSEVEGDLYSLLEQDEFEEIDANEEDWVLFELPKYPSLFEAAYKDEEELLNIMKDIYGQFVSAKNFDWEKRSVIFFGTIYC